MPKRGGRGGPGRNPKGAGGTASNYGRINGKKKKSKGTANNHRAKTSRTGDVPELMDLNENSMRNLSKRPGRLMQEALYTEKHHDETLGKTLRSRPIAFVKAKEVYDPSAELFKKKKDPEVMDGLEQTKEIEVETQDKPSSTTQSTQTQELLDILNSPRKAAPRRDSPVLTFSSGEEESEFELEEEEMEVEEENNGEETNDDEEESANPEEPLARQLSNTNQEEPSKSGSPQEELSVKDLNINEEDAFVIDDEGDSEAKFVVAKPDISSLIKNRASVSEESHPYTEPSSSAGLEHDPILTIGKVSLRTSKDSNGATTTELPRTGKRKVVEEDLDIYDESDLSENDVSGYQAYIQSVMQELNENSDYEDDEDGYVSSTNFDIMASSSEEEEEDSDDDSAENVEKDPEYGFLPEDYEFDVSQIEVSNVRFGIQNQYYTKNLDLTGSPDEFQWVDEEEFIDYVIGKGVKESRLSSFLKYITKGLVDQKFEEQPNYSDVYISESSDEEDEQFDDDDISQEGDDVEGLVDFMTKSKQNFVSIEDLDPTRSLITKGKGRKKRLDLDRMDLENDIRASLQDQFQTHRERKKNKKSEKEEAKIQEGFKNHDLLIKYPYTLHIKEIRNEFELFLHDSGRDSMSFPPLDPHGNKVLSKMASCYNFKAQKYGGNGLKQFVKVSKSRKTFHYLPRYDEIGHLLRQRPIFNRTDQKRPKDEIISTDGNIKKDRARGRNKSGMTIIQEGEVVGGKAPEISKDNIGRQLLEKLGWVKGEGLGAHGNKGISEPLLATMKKSKTGLK